MTQYRVAAKIIFFVSFGGAAIFGMQQASAAGKEETPIIAEARELLDTYYGNDNLIKASALLERGYKSNSDNSHFFVQAARATVMGGQMSFGESRPNTIERYGMLLDRAIALDDSNSKAHILKAQVFAYTDRAAQLAELDKAKALGTADPWLLVGYGDYCFDLKALDKAFAMYTEVQRRGPGSRESERRAYVKALSSLTGFPHPTDVKMLREYAALAMKARHPADAWTPLTFAESFLDEQLFDESIFHAREALKTMDFGAGRLALASALYGKAAQLTVAGKPPSDSQLFIEEARKFKFTKTEIFSYLSRRDPQGRLRALVPTFNSIIPTKVE
jgi:hypothetical protein